MKHCGSTYHKEKLSTEQHKTGHSPTFAHTMPQHSTTDVILWAHHTSSQEEAHSSESVSFTRNCSSRLYLSNNNNNSLTLGTSQPALHKSSSSPIPQRDYIAPWCSTSDLQKKKATRRCITSASGHQLRRCWTAKNLLPCEKRAARNRSRFHCMLIMWLRA